MYIWYSVAVVKHHDETSSSKAGFVWLSVQVGWESIVEERYSSKEQTWWLEDKLKAYIMTHKQETEELKSLSFSDPASNDIHPPTKLYLLRLSKQCHQLGPKIETSKPRDDIVIQTTTTATSMSTSLTWLQWNTPS